MGSVFWLLYFADLVTNVGMLLGIFGGFGLFVALGYSFVTRMDASMTASNWKWIPARFFIVPAIALFLCTLLPSKQTVLIGLSIDTVTQMEEVQNIGGEAAELLKNSLTLLNDRLKAEMPGEE